MADRQWSRDTEVEDMGFEKLDVSPLRNNIMYPIGQSSEKQHHVSYRSVLSETTSSTL